MCRLTVLFLSFYATELYIIRKLPSSGKITNVFINNRIQLRTAFNIL